MTQENHKDTPQAVLEALRQGVRGRGIERLVDVDRHQRRRDGHEPRRNIRLSLGIAREAAIRLGDRGE